MTAPKDRRELILGSAAELFARKSIAGTTVREIAEAVGILSGSLYHHFESKEAIVDEILTTYLTDLRAAYQAVLARGADPDTSLRLLVSASLETSRRHPHASEIYQNDAPHLAALPRFEYLRATAAEVQKTWLDVIQAGVAAGVFRSDVQPRVFYRLIRDAVWLSVRYQRTDDPDQTKKLAADVTTVFLDGFGTDRRAGGRAATGTTGSRRARAVTGRDAAGTQAV